MERGDIFAGNSTGINITIMSKNRTQIWHTVSPQGGYTPLRTSATVCNPIPTYLIQYPVLLPPPTSHIFILGSQSAQIKRSKANRSFDSSVKIFVF